MGIFCEIKLDEDIIFKSGDKVTGVLKYKIYKPTKMEFIVLSLKGDGRTHWVTAGFKPKAYLTSTEEYVSEDIIILENTETIQTGFYNYLFEFTIPHNIPSSFKKKKCKIMYRIEAVFSKAIFGFVDDTETFTKLIAVHGSIKPCSIQPLILEKTKVPFNWMKKEEIHLKVEIEKTLLKPGEDIKLNCVIKNDSNVKVKSITAKLVTHFVFKIRNTKKKKKQKRRTPKCQGKTEVAKCKSTSELTCVVPTTTNLNSIQNSEILEKSYVLNVTAKLPFPYKNVQFKIPVVIGEIVSTEEVVDQVKKGTSWNFKLKLQ